MLYNVRREGAGSGGVRYLLRAAGYRASPRVTGGSGRRRQLRRKRPPARNVIVRLFRGVFRAHTSRTLRLVPCPSDFARYRSDCDDRDGYVDGLLCHSFGFPYDVFKWSVAARLTGCKVRFVGVGVGPIYGRLSRIFIKTALAMADYRGFRDRQSRERLKQHGFERANDAVFPDLAFSLPPCVFPSSLRMAQMPSASWASAL